MSVVSGDSAMIQLVAPWWVIIIHVVCAVVVVVHKVVVRPNDMGLRVVGHKMSFVVGFSYCVTFITVGVAMISVLMYGAIHLHYLVNG
jgi:hypothetical protein